MLRRRNQHPQSNEPEETYDASLEPCYVENVDEPKRGRPKWQIPNSQFQREFLNTVGRKYYLDRTERYAVIQIEKAMMSLEKGAESKYPTEWVENCVLWAKKARAEHRYVRMDGLLSLINNEDRKREFVDRWKEKHARDHSL